MDHFEALVSSLQVCRVERCRGHRLELAVTDSVITTLDSADSVTPAHPASGGGVIYMPLVPTEQICHCYNHPIVNIYCLCPGSEERIVVRVKHCRGAGLVCVE